MSVDLADVMLKTDWELLRKQKLKLLSYSIEQDEEWDDFEAMTGIINWIDFIQDAVVDSGLVPEHVVFGELSDE